MTQSTWPRSAWIAAATSAADLAGAEAAVAAEGAGAPTGQRPSTFERDPHLVGIYGGDLDHIMDAMGTGPGDQAARSRRAEVQRSLAEAAAARGEHAPQPGEPETDEITEAVEARMAGWYAGDVDFVREHKDEH